MPDFFSILIRSLIRRQNVLIWLDPAFGGFYHGRYTKYCTFLYSFIQTICSLIFFIPSFTCQLLSIFHFSSHSYCYLPDPLDEAVCRPGEGGRKASEDGLSYTYIIHIISFILNPEINIEVAQLAKPNIIFIKLLLALQHMEIIILNSVSLDWDL